ncbi:MAG: FkbM family methyltransferase [bacterium]|nr:MAG: FkbM family methyltransferase [bacterium]
MDINKKIYLHLVKIRIYISSYRHKFLSSDGNLYWQDKKDDLIFNFNRKSVTDSLNVVNYAYKNLKKGDTCFDIGACIGAISVPFWKTVCKEGKVYSFEADKKNIKKIKDNLSLNRMPTKYVYNQAVSHKDSFMLLSIIRNQNGWQSLGDPKLDDDINKNEVTTAKVKTVTIDRFCKNNNISNIDLLKIDVEGAELDVLNGAKKMIKNGKIKKIIFEISPKMLVWHKRDAQSVISFFKDKSYRLFEIFANGDTKILKNNIWDNQKHGDVLAVLNEKNV